MLLDRPYIVLRLTVCVAIVVLVHKMPVTEALLLRLLLALELERLYTVLSEIVLVPLVTEMPLITPPVLVLVVAFTMLATVLFSIETTPLLKFRIPCTNCPLLLELEGDLALMLLGVFVLPIVLSLMVTVPEPAIIPWKLVAFVVVLLSVVMAPIVLFRQSTTPLPPIFIP